MNPLRHSLLAAASLCLASTGMANPLRAVICECDSPPMVEFADVARSKPAGGLIKDMVDLIAGQLKMPTQYIVLSRRRVDLALRQGHVDLVCFTSRQWTSQPEDLLWTGPTVPQVERILLHRQDKLDVRGYQDLRGLNIGLMLGFHYPPLEPMLRDGSLRATYQTDHVANFRLLERHLVGAVISTDLQIALYLKNNPEAKSQLVMSDLVFSTTPTECAIPKASPINANKVIQAVQQLRERGAFDQLMETYRSPLQ
ncbi:substrate-binding periplasmic protein [Parachitinimonas caeni]|uniref:Transporter substrate-binding domain-containing protein n=1 Tax=Parachitinimonas caeni TaxID=3031301 RepID=A0ABT7E0H6_9NEIS|nr:transporter substrate-binding domain-containing protein [Parachitinimonas caeni]MDK2125806.1 transporter substrate-binding domain-containing protein [Parachitinimonas caeni]